MERAPTRLIEDDGPAGRARGPARRGDAVVCRGGAPNSWVVPTGRASRSRGDTVNARAGKTEEVGGAVGRGSPKVRGVTAGAESLWRLGTEEGEGRWLDTMLVSETLTLNRVEPMPIKVVTHT